MAVGEEVVHHQHVVGAGQVLGGNGDGAFGLLGEGEHLGDQQVALQGQRLELAGEDHRNAQLQAGHDRRGDAGSLDGDDLGDALALEAFGEFMADLLHQQRVDLVVEEGVDFQHLFGENDAFAADFVFESVQFGAS
ncbi:hypothetical protein D3C76_1238320 [compost metagenome]